MPTYTNFPSVVAPTTYSQSMKPRIRSVEFGDAYTQESPNGLNYKLKSFSLTWDMLFDAEKNTIDNFLNARGGYQTFNWLNPSDSTVYKVKCRDWSVDYVNPTIWKITASFDQKAV
jgi:phage-related protein